MSEKSKLDQIKELLKMSKTELMKVKTKDGSEFEVDEMKVGANAFVMTDDGEKVALPDGDYTLEDGQKLEIKDGKISEISEKEKEDVDAEKENKEKMTYATKEELAEVKKGVDEVKAMIEEMAGKKKEDMSDQDKKDLSKENKKEDKKEDLSNQEPKKEITGAPESNEQSEQLKFGSQKGVGNTIMSNIAKLSK